MNNSLSSSNSHVTIKVAVASQVCEIERCVVQCLPNEAPKEREFYRWLFESKATLACVAVENDGARRIVGVIIGIAQQDAKGKRFGHVHTLCVEPLHRRKGLATRLIVLLEEWFVEFRAQYAALHVRKKNRAASKMYARLNYGRCKVVKKYYSDKQDALLLKKPLVEPAKKESRQPRVQIK